MCVVWDIPFVGIILAEMLLVISIDWICKIVFIVFYKVYKIYRIVIVS